MRRGNNGISLLQVKLLAMIAHSEQIKVTDLCKKFEKVSSSKVIDILDKLMRQKLIAFKKENDSKLAFYEVTEQGLETIKLVYDVIEGAKEV